MKTILSKLTFVAALAIGVTLTACNKDTATVPAAHTGHGVHSAHADHSDHGDHSDMEKAHGMCPVSGEPLGSMGDPIVVMHEGKEIKLCCEGCVDEFKSDPAKYASKVH